MGKGILSIFWLCLNDSNDKIKPLLKPTKLNESIKRFEIEKISTQISTQILGIYSKMWNKLKELTGKDFDFSVIHKW